MYYNWIIILYKGGKEMKKQTMKRIFTVIMAVCMLLSIAPVTMAADTADDGYQKGEIIEFG